MRGPVGVPAACVDVKDHGHRRHKDHDIEDKDFIAETRAVRAQDRPGNPKGPSVHRNQDGVLHGRLPTAVSRSVNLNDESTVEKASPNTTAEATKLRPEAR